MSVEAELSLWTERLFNSKVELVVFFVAAKLCGDERPLRRDAAADELTAVVLFVVEDYCMPLRVMVVVVVVTVVVVLVTPFCVTLDVLVI